MAHEESEAILVSTRGNQPRIHNEVNGSIGVFIARNIPFSIRRAVICFTGSR